MQPTGFRTIQMSGHEVETLNTTTNQPLRMIEEEKANGAKASGAKVREKAREAKEVFLEVCKDLPGLLAEIQSVSATTSQDALGPPQEEDAIRACVCAVDVLAVSTHTKNAIRNDPTWLWSKLLLQSTGK